MADAALATGERDFDRYYAGTRLQPGIGKVEVFLTDPAKGPRFLTALRKRDPGADTSRLVIGPAKYTERYLTAKSNLIMARARAGKLPFTVNSTFLPPDGSGLTVEVPDPEGARRALAADAASADTGTFDGAVTVVHGERMEALGGRVDFASLAGAGLNIENNAGYACTSGLPFYDKAVHAYYVLTAFHCYELLESVGTPTHPGLGQVTGISKPADASMIKVVAGGSPEAVAFENGLDDADGGISGKGITAVGNTAAGALVCHNGFISFQNGKGAPCDWEVKGKTQWNLTAHGITYTAKGMRAEPKSAAAVAYHGDSGAAVYTLNGRYAVKGVGMLSAGGGCDTGSCKVMAFVNVNDISAAFRSLSPMIYDKAPMND
ncbi:hypothetical protein [Actinomadura decatromicini]|uniref:S1 family peptidase n=1 Tax=Actinomadura decatromicini TaxID=2604572 RepID=A0A5D3FSY7_9ACTN|nr:hypothetical protein [Actinomadura decatromicini]TYK51026.1 hypothetical protein FXF68_11275 [Actinomadura decatromicini]